MYTKNFAKKIASEIRNERPVVVALIEGEKEIAHEILARISPTSRLIMLNARGTDAIQDERVEMYAGGVEEIARIAHTCKIEAFDAIITHTSHKKGEEETCLAKLAHIVKPSGICILFPAHQRIKHIARTQFHERKMRTLWRGFVPVRVFCGKKGVDIGE